MSPRLPKSVLLPLAVGLVQILSGCMASTVNDPNSDKSAGGSDEIDTRVAVDRSGKPVVAARIALVRPDDSTGKPVAVSATRDDGTFPSFVVPDGFYSMVLRDSGDRLGKYVDSVRVKNQKVPSGRDTLLTLGSIRGVVRVAAGHSPSLVSLGLVGTDILASAKADGTFRIELVPGGLYTLGAFTSMEGYGTLYKRIQLKDGQDLTLPDTLVMPFTGLPSPGALRVLQDTGNGNVRVSWNRVDHPDQLGYVLERVESGMVTVSRYLTDTTWTDSLGASWEAMPLLGPWPSREVAYRVRARSLSGLPDSKSVVQAITAKPPEWTKRMDSVKVTMTTDSVTRTTTLKWNALRHPDLVQWNVTRSVNGVPDCSRKVEGGTWNDAGCPNPVDRIVDSSRGGSLGTWTRVHQRQSADLSYAIEAIRKRGSSGKVATASRRDSVAPVVEWRDSILDPSKEVVGIDVIGGWLKIRYASGGGSKISKDGLSWEIFPDTVGVYFAGAGDSLWGVKKLNTSTWSLASRVGPELWASHRIAIPQGLCSSAEGTSLFGLYVDSGAPVIDCSWNAEFWKWKQGALESFRGYPDYDDGWICKAWSDSSGVLKLAYEYMYGVLAVLTRRPGESQFTLTDEVVLRSSFMEMRMLGELGTGELVFTRNPATEKQVILARSKSKEVYQISNPPSVSEPRGLIVWKDEIWALSSDGRLWKGKLNLPE